MKVRAVQKDARVLDNFGDDFTVLLYSRRAGTTLRFELPLVIRQALGGLLNPALIFGVGKMGTVTTATLHEFWRRTSEDTLATGPKNAGPITFEERHVEHPSALTLFVVKTYPFVGVVGNRSHNETIVGVS